jgi:GntR family transcriptional regulator
MTYEPIRRRGVSRLSREQWGMGRSMWEVDTEGRKLVVDRLVVSQERAPVDVAKRLEMSPRDLVCVRRRRFNVDDRPVQLATSYLPWELVKGTAITGANTGRGGTYALLALLDLKPVRFTEEASIRAATEDETHKLDLALCGCGCDNCMPQVIDMQRVAFAYKGQPVEVTKMVLDASVYILEYGIGA